jgi:hypothetical protein
MADPTSLSVEFQPTPDDYHALAVEIAPTRQELSESLFTLKIWIIVAAICGATTAVWITGALTAASFATAVVVASVFVLLFTLKWTTAAGNARHYKQMLSRGRNATLYRSRVVTIDSDWFRELIPDAFELRVRWSVLEAVDWTASFVVIYLTTAGMIMIPRRAFGSDVEFRTFHAAAQTFFNAAGGGKAKGFPVLQPERDSRERTTMP